MMDNELFWKIVKSQSQWSTAFKAAKKERKYEKQREEKRRYKNKVNEIKLI